MPETKSKAVPAGRQVKSRKSKVESQKTQPVKAVVKAKNELTALTYSLKGEEVGSLDLPKEIFGGKINKTLLAQALRVYINNSKAHWSDTKTRSEVKGSSRKIRVQKGTGGARHGSVRAPIFVKGGIALGPKFRKVELELPKKMKKAALISALSLKAKEGEIVALEGLEKVSGKTKQMQELINKIAKKKILIVTDGKNDNLFRAVRNLPNMGALAADQLNAFEVIAHQTMIFTKASVEKLESKIMKKEKNS